MYWDSVTVWLLSKEKMAIVDILFITLLHNYCGDCRQVAVAYQAGALNDWRLLTFVAAPGWHIVARSYLLLSVTVIVTVWVVTVMNCITLLPSFSGHTCSEIWNICTSYPAVVFGLFQWLWRYSALTDNNVYCFEIIMSLKFSLFSFLSRNAGK